MSEKQETQEVEQSDSAPEAPELEPAVARYEHLFGLPMAVQLRFPLMMMDAVSETERRDDGEWDVCPTASGLGVPQPAFVRDSEGRVLQDDQGVSRPAAQLVLAPCRIGASPDGRSLVLQYRTDKGATAAVTVEPAAVAAVTALPQVPAPIQLEPRVRRGDSPLIRPA